MFSKITRTRLHLLTDDIRKKMIKTLIVDDEIDSCKQLHEIIQSLDGDYSILDNYCDNTTDFETMLVKEKPDVVFLDINLKGERGIDFIARIGAYDFQLVFVTAFDDFALRAIKLNAVDYILKPIDISELSETLIKVKSRLATNGNHKKGRPVKQLFDRKIETQNSIIIKTHKDVFSLNFEQIISVSALGPYSQFVVSNNSKYSTILASYSLSYYSDILPEEIFFRCHKSFFINKSRIKSWHQGESFDITMEDGQTFNVSRRKQIDFLSFIKKAL